MATVVTANGERPAADLGVTLPHEHLVVDTSVWARDEAGMSAVARRKLNEPVSRENLWWLAAYGRRPDWNCLDNRRLDDVDLAIAEIERFAREGGGTVVDVTPMTPALGRDPRAMRQVANATGLHVVAGTGHYVRHAHPPDLAEQSVEAVTEAMVADLTEGIDDTTVRAGVIGEVGASEGFVDNEVERKSFRAAAAAQRRTGAPITVHPPVYGLEGHDVLDVLEDAGADLSNVILGHLDAILEREEAPEYLDAIAERGVYVEFDTFGRMGYLEGPDACFPLDETRIRELRRLADAGFGDRLLVSQDVCKKNQLTEYAGHGYDYIPRDIVPRLRRRGFSDAEVDALLVDNPARALAWE